MECKEFSCDYTDEAVCPHCGLAVQGIWELFVGDEQMDGAMTHEDCANCGKLYEIRRNIEVTYTTTKPGGENEETRKSDRKNKYK